MSNYRSREAQLEELILWEGVDTDDLSEKSLPIVHGWIDALSVSRYMDEAEVLEARTEAEQKAIGVSVDHYYWLARMFAFAWVMGEDVPPRTTIPQVQSRETAQPLGDPPEPKTTRKPKPTPKSKDNQHLTAQLAALDVIVETWPKPLYQMHGGETTSVNAIGSDWETVLSAFRTVLHDTDWTATKAQKTDRPNNFIVYIDRYLFD